MAKDLFIVHPSVLQDAFRTDYPTSYRQSAIDFLDLLFKHKREHKCKIGITSGEVFTKLSKGPLGKTKSIGIIFNDMLDIDIKSFGEEDIDQSIVKLAARKGVAFKPWIVTTKKVSTEGTSILTKSPREAIDLYHHPQTNF